MEHTFTGCQAFMASHYSVLVTGVLVPLAACAAWALYRYHFQPSDTHRSVDVKIQQALRRYVLIESTHGKPDCVLQAFKEYASKDVVIKGLLFTVEQDIFLEEAAKQCYPKATLVLGTQCGYSPIRLLQFLPSDGMLYAVEGEDSMAESAEEMILVAGFKHNQFKLLCQHPVDAIHVLKSQFGVKKLDFVLMDYECDQYVEGLLALTESGILYPGTLILANNTNHPTSKNFIQYIEGAEDYRIVDACKGLLKVEYVQPKSLWRS
ncbi:transmembrane O-methyltransferase homolog [Bufo gargarizans]|uniref:transmembrane O-methyltransferase homolog n=1 Tax=Bufo gargarizans TaxID=30331 RepID=UPI001CF1E704|nr:transmembrane O-methyltransferase homolog [Bufo gargarizans]